MSKEILIHSQKGERQVAIIENGHVDDFHIELDRYQSLLGNIYKGRVESILPSINAAFVNIGQPRNGFLYLTDAVSPPEISEEIEAKGNILTRIFGKKEKEEAEEQKPANEVKNGNRHHRSRRRSRKYRHQKQEIPFKVGQEIMVQVVKDPFGEKGARLTTHVTLAGRFVVYMPFDKQTGVSKKIESGDERQRLREIIRQFTFAKMGGNLSKNSG